MQFLRCTKKFHCSSIRVPVVLKLLLRVWGFVCFFTDTYICVIFISFKLYTWGRNRLCIPPNVELRYRFLVTRSGKVVGAVKFCLFCSGFVHYQPRSRRAAPKPCSLSRADLFQPVAGQLFFAGMNSFSVPHITSALLIPWLRGAGLQGSLVRSQAPYSVSLWPQHVSDDGIQMLGWGLEKFNYTTLIDAP